MPTCTGHSGELHLGNTVIPIQAWSATIDCPATSPRETQPLQTLKTLVATLQSLVAKPDAHHYAFGQRSSYVRAEKVGEIVTAMEVVLGARPLGDVLASEVQSSEDTEPLKTLIAELRDITTEDDWDQDYEYLERVEEISQELTAAIGEGPGHLIPDLYTENQRLKAANLRLVLERHQAELRHDQAITELVQSHEDFKAENEQLKAALADPDYRYLGSSIRREDILVRNARIDELRGQLKTANADLAKALGDLAAAREEAEKYRSAYAFHVLRGDRFALASFIVERKQEEAEDLAGRLKAEVLSLGDELGWDDLEDGLDAIKAIGVEVHTLRAVANARKAQIERLKAEVERWKAEAKRLGDLLPKPIGIDPSTGQVMAMFPDGSVGPMATRRTIAAEQMAVAEAMLSDSTKASEESSTAEKLVACGEVFRECHEETKADLPKPPEPVEPLRHYKGDWPTFEVKADHVARVVAAYNAIPGPAPFAWLRRLFGR